METESQGMSGRQGWESAPGGQALLTDPKLPPGPRSRLPSKQPSGDPAPAGLAGAQGWGVLLPLPSQLSGRTLAGHRDPRPRASAGRLWGTSPSRVLSGPHGKVTRS